MNHIIENKFVKIIALLCAFQLACGSSVMLAGDPNYPPPSPQRVPLEFRIDITDINSVCTPADAPAVPCIIATLYAQSKVLDKVNLLLKDEPLNKAVAGFVNEVPFSDAPLPVSCRVTYARDPAGDDNVIPFTVHPMGDIPVAVLNCLFMNLDDRLKEEPLEVHAQIHGTIVSHISDPGSPPYEEDLNFNSSVSRIVVLNKFNLVDQIHLILAIVQSNHDYLSTLVTSGITGVPQALEELKRMILNVPQKVKMVLQPIFDRIMSMLREILSRLPIPRR